MPLEKFGTLDGGKSVVDGVLFILVCAHFVSAVHLLLVIVVEMFSEGTTVY